MKFEELTAEDQALLNTDLGEFDKLAAEQVAVANEMYEMGFNKLAAETADALDELFASEKVAAEKEEEEKDEETEKKAAELAAFIERGYFDGLRKLGSERYGDEGAYLLPLIAEKVAEDAKAGVFRRFAEGAKAHGGKALDKIKGVAEKAKDKSKRYWSDASNKIESGKEALKYAPEYLKSKDSMAQGVGKGMQHAGRKQIAQGYAMKAAPVAAGGLALGGAGYGIHKATKKKKED